MLTGFRFAALFLALAPGLSAATLEDRLERLEARVSEMQLLLEQLSKKQDAPAAQPRPQASPGRSYEIRRGDSYWSIARRHDLTVEALTAANPGVDPRRLSIGKTITLPGPPSPTRSTASTRPQKSEQGSATTSYRVRPGDVMGRIAQKHGISLAELMAANPGVDPRRLRIGKILTVPGQDPVAPTPPTETRSGLSEDPEPARSEFPSVAENPYLKALDSSPDPVRSLGGATDGLRPDPSEPILVTLDEDTRFSDIARQHQTTVARLNELNRRELSPDQMIKAGSQLYIPPR